MNKREFVTAMKEHMNFDTLAEAEKSIDAFIKTMKAEIKKGNKVDLIGFGKFEKVAKAARKGRNPKTGEELQIPAKEVAKFTASKTLIGD